MHVNNFYFDKSSMPPYMPHGMYKVQFHVLKDSIIDSGMEVLAGITLF